MTKRYRSEGKRHGALRAALALLLIGSTFSDTATADPPQALDTVGGPASTHIVVRLDATFARAVRNVADHDGVLRGVGAQRVMSAGQRGSWAQWGVTEMRPAYPFAFKHPELAAKHRLDRYYFIQVPRGTDTPAMAEAFGAHRREIELAATDTIGEIAAFIPNDSRFNEQWNMHNTGQSGGTEDADVDAPEAWDIHTGLTGDVTIAIIDSGVSPHIDFGDRLIAGINTDPFSSDTLTVDECGAIGHGTHVAGIAAATGNNEIGVAGMTWGARIMPVRVLGTPNPCSGFSSALANGIIWAADNGADVANVSLQFYDLSPAAANSLQAAVNFAHDLGVVLVGATGNNNGGGCNCPGFVAYPARLDHFIAVAGTDDDDNIALLSNWGLEVDVSAPGNGIYSTFRSGDTYGRISGTSMATPHVAGLAALMKSYIPELTNNGIEQIIVDSVDDLGPTGWDVDFGWGRINAHQALLAAEDWPRIISSLPPEGSIDARAPHKLDDSEALLGWRWVYLTFPAPVSGLVPEDFVVSQEGGVAGTPVVATVEQLTPDRVKVTFDERLDAGAWTTITHVDSQTSVRVGFLPGDVSGDGTSTANDVAALMDTLNGVGDPRDLWSVDIDHTWKTHPADLLSLIDVLNGAGAFDPYLDVSLP